MNKPSMYFYHWDSCPMQWGFSWTDVNKLLCIPRQFYKYVFFSWTIPCTHGPGFPEPRFAVVWKQILLFVLVPIPLMPLQASTFVILENHVSFCSKGSPLLGGIKPTRLNWLPQVLCGSNRNGRSFNFVSGFFLSTGYQQSCSSQCLLWFYINIYFKVY